jgi:hypothetical protein
MSLSARHEEIVIQAQIECLPFIKANVATHEQAGASSEATAYTCADRSTLATARGCAGNGSEGCARSGIFHFASSVNFGVLDLAFGTCLRLHSMFTWDTSHHGRDRHPSVSGLDLVEAQQKF